ncbi:tetratricopeptide repeat protein [Flavobacterium silvaticum]|uniref:Tetratricopeptide repeat protein n=1 Tax=Flavobacterium silvaticum TaxID=1852020 RepID=A0A972JKY3_9FLAO|nr:hypothetical protein [Flavobacterium silvaticum]NMH29607.1 hypothetical protein [Flavobacterium silvaticum]
MSRFLIPILVFCLMGNVSASVPSAIIFENSSKEKGELMGDEACRIKDWESARIHYKKALASDASNSYLHFKYGAVLAMIASKDKWRGLSFLGEMRESFETAIKLDPSQIEARWALVEYYLQVPGILGGSEAKATKYASQLSAISEVDGMLAKARIAVYFGRDKQAEAVYLKAIAKFKSGVARQKLIELYTKNKEIAKADALKNNISKITKN